MAMEATEEVVSPSLLKGIVAKPVPLDLRIGMEELLSMSLNPTDYLLQQDILDDVDQFLLAASQNYESGETADCKYMSEELLLAASQQFEFESLDAGLPYMDALISVASDGPSNSFGSPQSSGKIEAVKKSRIPKKTQANTVWAENIWREWANYRLKNLSQEERRCGHKLDVDVTNLAPSELCFRLQRFVLEGSGEHYCPDSLYQLICGLQRALRNADQDINFFDQFQFAQFHNILDGELKRLNGTGKYIHKKKASVITLEIEEILWEKGLLGDCSPQVLSDTMVYLIGLFFALRSCEEHRQLRHQPSQFQLEEPPRGTQYLLYKEDISKTNQSRLKQWKLIPKEVVQYANETNSARCLVRLYKLYNALCPPDRPDHAFYLAPLTRPKENCWFKRTPLGHCKLAEVVPRLMKSAGIPGYFTNHSLRATATTRLYDVKKNCDLQKTYIVLNCI